VLVKVIGMRTNIPSELPYWKPILAGGTKSRSPGDKYVNQKVKNAAVPETIEISNEINETTKDVEFFILVDVPEIGHLLPVSEGQSS
jgi:hypothetical protein